MSTLVDFNELTNEQKDLLCAVMDMHIQYVINSATDISILKHRLNWWYDSFKGIKKYRQEKFSKLYPDSTVFSKYIPVTDEE